MKIFHSYQMEYIHKTFYSGANAIILIYFTFCSVTIIPTITCMKIGFRSFTVTKTIYCCNHNYVILNPVELNTFSKIGILSRNCVC